ncbi:MAG TPA: DUF2179 domain-containing protein [Bacteroidales bacterium]|nr:DUF2179 domain-containing protein [Bacteroidales bacterium]
MNILNFLVSDAPVFTWVILPLLIFCARIFDQSVGTLRMIFVAKGLKKWAPVFAFFESLIWLLAIGEIMKHLDNPLCYIAYAGGYAMGNYVGMVLDEKMSIGSVIIRVMMRSEAVELIAHLRASNYGITMLNAEGATGKVTVILSIIKRKDVNDFISILNEFNPQSFYTIEEVRAVNEGVFRTSSKRHVFRLHQMIRKHK